MIYVIIPHFNRFTMLKRAMTSVLMQSFSDFELIIVDDGSTEIGVEEVQKQFKGKAQWLLLEHDGVSAARNQGARMAKGDWIAFLDSDDLWHPEKLAKQMAFHRENRGILISQTGEKWIREGKEVKIAAKYQKQEGDLFAQSLELCSISPSSVMMHKDLFFKYGAFDERLPACEDYDLWLKITAKEEIGLLPEALMTRHGGHDDQLSFKYPAMDRFRIFALFKFISGSEMTLEQRQQATATLETKVMVLLKGAEKRGRDLQDLMPQLEALKNKEPTDLNRLGALLLYDWG